MKQVCWHPKYPNRTDIHRLCDGDGNMSFELYFYDGWKKHWVLWQPARGGLGDYLCIAEDRWAEAITWANTIIPAKYLDLQILDDDKLPKDMNGRSIKVGDKIILATPSQHLRQARVTEIKRYGLTDPALKVKVGENDFRIVLQPEKVVVIDQDIILEVK